MSCLLPQFKCQYQTFSINFRPHHSRHKEPVCFREQCVLSTTSPSTLKATTAMLDVEKLSLPIFSAHTNTAIADREETYIEATGPPSACFGTTLGTKNLLTSDETVIVAAAAEAIALARAVVNVSKDVGLMFKSYGSSKTETKSTTDTSTSKWALFTESERAGIIGDGLKDVRKLEDHSERNSTKESDELEPTNEELELLEEELSRNVAVRSKRQPERKARRTKAAAEGYCCQCCFCEVQFHQ